MTQQRLATTLGTTVPPDGPRPLPYSAYPKARDVAWHGLQSLPASLPLVDFGELDPTAAAGTPRSSRRT